MPPHTDTIRALRAPSPAAAELQSRAALPGGEWPHRLAVVTAAATMLLILAGGLVTNTGSALAVPDWPTTFGYNMFLYPWSRMVGGIFYEHSHRLIGSVVGMLTLALTLCLWVTEPRKWVCTLGLVAAATVIVQGILGGLRVVLVQHDLAVIHGCLAQGFFGLMVSLAVFTSRGWLETTPPGRLANAAPLRLLALITPVLVYLQLVLGAFLTHTGMRLDLHVLFAGAVTVATCLCAGRVLLQHAERAELRRPAVLLFVLLATQLTFGLGAYLWRFTTVGESVSPGFGLALLATHRVIGAAVWATAVVLSLRILRLVAVAQASGQGLLPVGLNARDRQVLA